MEIIVIAAMAANRVIGKDGKMPWHLPEDLHYFKQTTMGHPVVIGRKTFDSIGFALPGRRTVVISRNQDAALAGCERVSSLEEAFRLLAGEEKIFIAGGGAVYQQALPVADKVMLTVIDQSYAGDTFFPDLSEKIFCLQEERELIGAPGCKVRIYKKCQNRLSERNDLFEVRVDCYSGYQGEETPRRMHLGGRTVAVAEVLDRWLAPDHRYFKVRGDDRALYILRHDVAQDLWQVTLFQPGKR